MEKCTPIIAESQLYGSSTDGAGTSGRNRADDFTILDEGIESSPPQLSDFSGRLQEVRLAFTLPEKKSNSTSGVFQVIVHAPPGELGLTIIGDSKSGLVQVHRIKFSRPLRNFIQEGDVLESVDGEFTAGLTSTKTFSLISCRASNTSRALVFVRNVDERSNSIIEQSCGAVKVIVYAPPGKLGLSIIGDSKNGYVTMQSVESCSPLFSKIHEGALKVLQ